MSSSSPRPRLLWIAPSAPGARRSGAPVYSAGLVAAAAEAGAKVTFLGLRNPDGDGESSGPFGEGPHPQLTWRVIDAPPRRTASALVSPLPLVAARFSPAPVRRALREILTAERFDAVVLDNYGAGWAIETLDALAGAARLVYVAHNDETRLTADIAAHFAGHPLRKLALAANARKTRLLERRLLARADVLATLTPQDRDSLSAAHPVATRLVLPPGYAGRRVAARRITAGTPRRVVMLGSVRWIAKRMNTASFLAAADGRFAAAGIGLDIIGDVPDEFRAEWEPRLRATRFLGFVDDLRGALDQARLGLIVEGTGGGFKLKTLDYAFQRVPVAALHGACAGLPEGLAASMITASGMDDLAGAVIEAIDDVARLNVLQEGAYDAATRHFDWARNGRVLCEALAPAARPFVQAA